MKILVVDDRQENILFLEKLLEGFGHEVLTAVNGQHALEKLRADHFSMVITDILMPIMDGFQLCREVRRDAKLRKILFVFYTATYVSKEDEEFALKLGADRFVRKPAEPEKFMDIISELIEEMDDGRATAREPEFHHEDDVLKEYSARLVRKLEHNILKLEKEVAVRRAAEKKVKEMNDELRRANRELRTLDEMKTNFLSNISHELRTPLVTIRGYAELMLAEKAGELPEPYRRYLQQSLKCSRKILGLVNNLLEFSRLEQGGDSIHAEPFAVQSLVREELAIIHPHAEVKNISVREELGAAPCYINADRDKVSRIIANLLENAVKFTPPGGTITAACACGSHTVTMVIADDGIGIPEEEQDKVFERFYQVDSSKTRVYSGMGIGLSVVQDLVRLQGGEVAVKSWPGEGTTFTVSFSAAHPVTPVLAADDAAVPSRPVARERPARVLIVEDDPSVNQFMTIALEMEEYIPLVAFSGKEALAIARKEKLDVILLDVAMPGMDGVEVCRQLKGNPRTKDIPIIIVTALVEEEVAERSRAAGADGYVRKPFSMHELIAEINAALKS